MASQIIPEIKEEILERVGLSKNETKVFLTLLRLGSASVGKITEYSGVHRRNAYDSLERLEEKGLVGHAARGKVKFFEATDPHRLLDMVKKNIEVMSEIGGKIKSIIPELILVKKLGVETQDVKIYKGQESRRIIFEDILRTAKENFVLGAHTPSKASINYLRVWHKRRVKKGIKDKLLYCKPESWAKELSKLPLTEMRFLPKRIKTTTAINIYRNKVGILIRSNGQPISILIDNKSVAEDFKEYFRFLWEISKKRAP